MQTSVLKYWHRTLAAHPDREAVVDGARAVTFAELDAEAWRMAAAVIEELEGFNRPVAVFIPKSVDAVVAFLGVLLSGNFYVPIDTSSPLPRLEKIFAALEPGLVITTAALADKLSSADVAGAKILIAGAADGAIEPARLESARREQRIIDTDPVYIKYTSGSTGSPKGVALPHRAIIDYIDWAVEEFAITENSVIGNQAPFYFDVSVQDIYLCFATGARLVLVPEGLFTFPVKLLEYVAKEGVTFICWVPSMVVHIANLDLLARADTSHFETIAVLGEVMPTRHFNHWIAHVPAARFYNTYGPTEAAVASTYFLVERPFADHEPLPIGRACSNTDVFLLGADGERVSAPEAVGEICIRGSSLALGYWGEPDKTAEAFIANPLQGRYAETVYRTGDLGAWNELGELMFLGRKDSQIKHMGYRIELGEIETAANSIAGVEACCVLYDSGKREIALFYQGPEELAVAALRRSLREHLPTYMIPRLFLKLAEFPLNPNGKIDRPSLAREHLS